MTKPMNQSLEYSPPWAEIYSSFDEESVTIGIRSLRKIFYVEVVADDLGDWSKKEQFLQLLQDAPDDVEVELSLQDLIWTQFLPILSSLTTPTYDETTLPSLQDFYGMSIFPYKLIGHGKDVQVVYCPENLTQVPKLLLPQVKLSDIINSDQVIHISASKVQISSSATESSDIYVNTPTKVTIQGSPVTYYFKVVRDHTSFLREIKILLQLAQHRLNKNYRFPVLHSLVTYSDRADTVLGMLLDYIDYDDNLGYWIATRNPSHQLRKKWNLQIKDMTRALHRHDIIWGDVKPENVLIDHERNAWIIDFGGGYNSGYVDEAVMETIAGDDQGISRMEETLVYGKKY